MFDDRIEWLASIGKQGQWGPDPWSQSEKHVAFVRGFTEKDGFRMAEVDGVPAGALVIDEEPMPYVSPVEERELYVQLLLTAREFHGRGIGAALLERAKQEATERGITLIRVDCWAGGGGDLVDYYVRQGFAPTETFTVRDWPGQVLELRLRR